jgi:hypothetical protein
MRPNVLFIGEQVIKDRTYINENVDTKAIRQTILMAQEEKLHPVLGTNFYNRLQDGIENGNLTQDEELLLNNYIVPVMVWYVMAELPMTLGVKYYNRNVLRKTGENSDSLSMTEMRDVMDYYKSKAEFQQERMVRHLMEYASETKYREYLYPGDGCDKLRPKAETYTCPFVLDDRPKRRYGYDYE